MADIDEVSASRCEGSPAALTLSSHYLQCTQPVRGLLWLLTCAQGGCCCLVSHMLQETPGWGTQQW